MEENTQSPSATLARKLYSYTIVNHQRIYSVAWDINAENVYEEERNRIINELGTIVQSHVHDVQVTINNIEKYWERLRKQSKIREEYGNNLPSTVTFDEEFNDRFEELDEEIIPGYEPEPNSKFELNGYVIPEEYGKYKTIRGRPRSDKMTTTPLENFNFLRRYIETPEILKELEEDRKREEQKLSEKRGRGRPKLEKNISTPSTVQNPPTQNPIFSVKISSNISTSNETVKDKNDINIKDNKVEVPEVRKGRGRPKGSKNKPKINISIPTIPTTLSTMSPSNILPVLNENVDENVDIQVEDIQKKRGRPLGSKNRGATAEKDKNVIIYDKEIIFRQNPDNFEKHLIQYARKNRNISYAQWAHHGEKELIIITSLLERSKKECLNEWEKINSQNLFELKEYLTKKIEGGEMPYMDEETMGNFTHDKSIEDSLNDLKNSFYLRFNKYMAEKPKDIRVSRFSTYVNNMIRDPVKESEDKIALVNEIIALRNSYGKRNNTIDGKPLIDRSNRRKSFNPTIKITDKHINIARENVTSDLIDIKPISTLTSNFVKRENNNNNLANITQNSTLDIIKNEHKNNITSVSTSESELIEFEYNVTSHSDIITNKQPTNIKIESNENLLENDKLTENRQNNIECNDLIELKETNINDLYLNDNIININEAILEPTKCLGKYPDDLITFDEIGINGLLKDMKIDGSTNINMSKLSELIELIENIVKYLSLMDSNDVVNEKYTKIMDKISTMDISYDRDNIIKILNNKLLLSIDCITKFVHKNANGTNFINLNRNNF